MSIPNTNAAYAAMLRIRCSDQKLVCGKIKRRVPMTLQIMVKSRTDAARCFGSISRVLENVEQVGCKRGKHS